MYFGQLDDKTMQNPNRHIFYCDRKDKISLFPAQLLKYITTDCVGIQDFDNPDLINAKLDRK